MSLSAEIVVGRSVRGLYVAKKRGSTFIVIVEEDDYFEDARSSYASTDAPEVRREHKEIQRELKEAYENHDYFSVTAVTLDGKKRDSLGSMAGYGGPKRAAEAFVRDYL